MFSKPWFRSKTVWLNAVTFVSLVLGVVLTALSATPEPVSPWLPWAIGLALAVANLVLRVWFTDAPIG